MLLFITAAAASSRGQTVLSFGLFLFLCFFEAAVLYSERKALLDLRLLLTVSWLGGISLSCLKLSHLQSVWGIRMWASVFIFYFSALFVNDLISGAFRRAEEISPEPRGLALSGTPEQYRKKLMSCILVIFAAGFLSFAAECIVFRGELPILSDKPHAYTAFHITGIHYFIVSMMFVPVLSVLYLFSGKTTVREKLVLSALSGCIFLIYVLMLSKLQILFTAALPAMTALLLQRRFKTRTLALFFLGVFLVFAAGVILLMSMRHYPEGYLEKIFQFRDTKTPAAFQYVYTYIVNNFENLNLLTENLQHYSFGIRQLFPLFALTGAKFLPPVASLLSVEQYLTIEELTTLTVLYDAYGDFGVTGTLLFGVLFGAFTGYAEALLRKRNTAAVLLYVQLAVYAALAFFTTWFSNPTTWFWFAVTVFIVMRLSADGDGFKECLRRTWEAFLPGRLREKRKEKHI